MDNIDNNAEEELKWNLAFKAVDATALRITQNFNATMKIASEEYETDKLALEVAYMPDEEFQDRMVQLHEKHSLNAFGLRRDFDRRLQLGLG
ncbi:hypothetical protein LCGC14_0536120 [marine sediment metagenome]|uniref:Uncharacterized protein n=1 Tax=marine sediment metagenome TaxID=412755 RepID=A0A0F9RU73_9ZZZZ